MYLLPIFVFVFSVGMVGMNLTASMAAPCAPKTLSRIRRRELRGEIRNVADAANVVYEATNAVVASKRRENVAAGSRKAVADGGYVASAAAADAADETWEEANFKRNVPKEEESEKGDDSAASNAHGGGANSRVSMFKAALRFAIHFAKRIDDDGKTHVDASAATPPSRSSSRSPSSRSSSPSPSSRSFSSSPSFSTSSSPSTTHSAATVNPDVGLGPLMSFLVSLAILLGMLALLGLFLVWCSRTPSSTANEFRWTSADDEDFIFGDENSVGSHSTMSVNS